MEPIRILLPTFFNWVVFTESIALVFLLFCSAMISGTEIAFFSLSKTDLDLLSKEHSPAGDRVLSLLNKPKKLLATILIANNFINILIVLLFAVLGAYFFENLEAGIRFLIEVVLITFLILLFGEVLPKVYATRNSIPFALFMANPVVYLNRLLSPASYLLTGLTGVVERRLGKKDNDFSVEKLSQALELTADNATTKDEKNILEGIVAFGNTETVQVMKPRIDIFAIPDDASFPEVLSKIISNGFSRNPVYHQNIDEVIGVLYAKDLLPHLTKTEFNWQALVRAPYFVPENKKLDDLLIDFQEKKNHLAIVVDEYGGTSGLVTLEDVIEEIVGDISDEFDSDDLVYSKLDANNYVFEGKTALKDFYRVLDIDPKNFEVHKGEAETLAGFILEISGKFPKKFEKINFEAFVFTVEAVDRKRIKQLKVTLLQ
ncbi:MAG: gliding motility-associated protein GldE [Flavicella sp.]|nr:gliding motility-associated protein GldE [Flavicella sp.]